MRMRIRKLSALFWSTCIAVFIFILYVTTDLTFKLPSIKPAYQDVDESKWSLLQSKLQRIEKQLNHHNEVVGEIKSAFNQAVDREQAPKLTPEKKRQEEAIEVNKEDYDKPLNEDYDDDKGKDDENVKDDDKKDEEKEMKAVGEEPPQRKYRAPVNFDQSTCPAKFTTVPHTDIQMLTMYERITFDDKDGGVWKQGWDIQTDDKQWNSQRKLKVFVVPHSHNDPGWLKTFENYYKTETRSIFTNMVQKLNDKPGRKFIWCEISFLALWWSQDATEEEKNAFKRLLNNGNIEIVTGGWVMNDEANSHWLSIIQQLTSGHQWLIDQFNYIPRNSWAIDPFGHSSSQPYLLKLAGFDNSLIQRIHYRIKKELALNKQLEFQWRQLWDGVGKTDMFTHMMPFYSYDVPHTCGPDPKICCQFDFKRLPGNGVSCPWGIPPVRITVKNVYTRANMILDQWRKKAQLYRSNVLLVPLGDDFRYSSSTEWDHQYSNYEMLIDYINSQENFHAEVQFGTLDDYFTALHAEMKTSNFPVLSGDFFTYADRNQHYWSGYYTSRPFYKHMDRALLAYVRAAETITSQAVSSGAVSNIMAVMLRARVTSARHALALFQHHDGVTGTSRDDVRADYAKKLFKAIKDSQGAIQQAAYHLLKQPRILEQTQEDIYFDIDDVWHKHDELPNKITIVLDAVSPSRRIVLYNALAFKRTEIVTFIVSSPHVEVFDPSGDVIMSQVSPVAAGEARLGFAANKFQLMFPVTVGPLALTTYSVSLRDTAAINKHTSYAHVRIYNAEYWSVDLPKMFPVEHVPGQLDGDVSFKCGRARVVANMNGLLKSVDLNGKPVPVHMDYIQYDSLRARDNNSGAYLFIPSGPAKDFKSDPYPEIVITEGIHKSTLYTSLIGSKKAEILLAMSLYNNPSLEQSELEISNTFLIKSEPDDVELAMRFATGVQNGDTFYTDLNGMQMIKRRYFDKLPIQANFYPLPAAAYIEDGETRFTVLTSTPLGMAALSPGVIEVMQDRRLTLDDNRGVNQGVLDNVRTQHVFKLVLESANTPCANKTHSEHPSGQLSLGAHVTSQLLLQPIVAMQYSSPADAPRPAFSRPISGAADVVLAAFQSQLNGLNEDDKKMHGTGMTFQRVHLDACYGSADIARAYPVGDGVVQISEYMDTAPGSVYESTLTFNRISKKIPNGMVTLCPMEIRSVFIDTSKQSKKT